MSLLAKSLGDAVRQRYVILLDVHRSHIDQTILAHAKRCGVRLCCYVPASMTETCSHVIPTYSGSSSQPFGIASDAAKLPYRAKDLLV